MFIFALTCVGLAACSSLPTNAQDGKFSEPLEHHTGSLLPRKNADVKVIDKDSLTDSMNRQVPPSKGN